jgi:hypothetical protein
MLNGQRKMWYFNEVLAPNGHWHWVVPSTRHFSAWSNNMTRTGFVFMGLLGTALLSVPAILVTVLWTWIAGVVLFALATLPTVGAIKRVTESVAFRISTAKELRAAENLFSELSPGRQKEYAEFLGLAYKSSSDIDKVVELFKLIGKDDPLKAKLDMELVVHKEMRQIDG